VAYYETRTGRLVRLPTPVQTSSTEPVARPR
jgi:hypothetical protein